MILQKYFLYIHPKFQPWQYSIPNIDPRYQSSVPFDSGDSTWPDPSISFSQNITGDIKMKIEIIIRSICNAIQFSTMTYK